MTDAQWKEVGTIVQRMHQVQLPPEGFASCAKKPLIRQGMPDGYVPLRPNTCMRHTVAV